MTSLGSGWILRRRKKGEFSPNLKMLSFFCFSKLGAPLFRFFLSRPETSISGENPCFPISGGHVHPPTTFLQKIMIVKIHVLVVGGCTWPPEIGKYGFSPEMDVSGWDKKNWKAELPTLRNRKMRAFSNLGKTHFFRVSCVHTKMSKDLAMKKNMLIFPCLGFRFLRNHSPHGLTFSETNHSSNLTRNPVKSFVF